MVDLRRVFIARNKQTNFHSVFEVIPSSYVEIRKGVLEPEFLNGLLQWERIAELARVLEKSGPFIAKEIYPKASRIISIDDALSIAEAMGQGAASEGFTRNDPQFLRMQLYSSGRLYLDGQTGGYPSRSCVAKDATRYGLVESRACEDLRRWRQQDPECKVAIEPLSDLVLVRNTCSILLRLIANYQAGKEDVLESSGFEHVTRQAKWWNKRSYKDSYYVIPFVHNSSFNQTVNFSTKWFKSVFGYTLVDPLRYLIDETKSSVGMHGMGSVQSATMITPPAIDGKAYPVFNFHFDYDNEDTRFYLGLCDDVSQREAAELFVGSYAEMFSKLRNKEGKPLGWSFDEIPDLMSNDFPQPVFHTLAAAVVGSIVYRNGNIPVACKRCGSGIMVKPKGKRREFCSTTCKTLHSKYAREGVEGGRA